jgi:hypothetical protein
VSPPIEDGSCGRGGSWSRIDDGGPPLYACFPASPPAAGTAAAAMPDIAGARLDHAESYLDSLGIHHETSGGGLFGILDSSNWEVCATTPRPGAGAGAGARLYVDRSC